MRFFVKLITVILLAALAVVVLAAFWLWTPDKRRAELERDYLASPADMIDIQGALLHVRDDGPAEAPAVIMVHGFGASLHTWEPWASALSQSHRVIRFDLPGSGLSPPDPENDYRDQRVIALLLALMDEKAIARASLIGHSIGGRIAWRAAADHPERIEKLVLIAPDGFASPGFEYGRAPETSMLLNVMRYVLPKAMLRSNLAQSYGDPAALTGPTVDRYYDLMLAPGSRQALLNRLEQTVLADPRPLLERIARPVLLVWGEQDGLIPFSNAQDYLDHLPDARLVSFPGLGHVPHEEAPETTLPPVAEFLSEPESASSTAAN